MYNVFNGNLVVDYKGIYTIEKFLLSRKLMYLQVYMHKTVLSAEHTLMNILKRAKYLASNNISIFSTNNLKKFLSSEINMNDKKNIAENLKLFSKLDDYDIMTSIKEWQNSNDHILSCLSKQIIQRKLHKIHEIDKKDSKYILNQTKKKLNKKYIKKSSDSEYFVFLLRTKHKIYTPKINPINVLNQKKNKLELSSIEKELNFNKKQNTIIKNFICYHPSIQRRTKNEF